MLLINLVLAGLGACLCQLDAETQTGQITSFDQFEKEFDLHYLPEERLVRQHNFRKSLQLIAEHNSRSDDVFLAVNHLADWSGEEYSEWLGQAEASEFFSRISASGEPIDESSAETVPHLSDSVDWRQHGKVTPIKSQGHCGACWAFATVATVESAYLINQNLTLDLSEQELVDCASNTKKYYNKGCEMGFSDVAFDYIHDYGLVEEKFYAYHARDQACDNETLRRSHNYGIASYQIVPFNSTDQVVMRAIQEHGPVSAGMNAGSDIFRFYSSGIIRNVMPGMIIPNHVVAIVGYETINGTDVWIIRNSWGTKWGYGGYAYVERHQNQMGLNNYVVYPLLK